MSYRYAVSCYWPDLNSRMTEYTGLSLFAAWRAYRRAKHKGAQHFVLEYRP